MAISFARKGKWVELNEFSNQEVIEYLASKLNTEKNYFKLLAQPKFCNGVMVEFDGVNFIIYAKNTWIELSFEKANAQKMATVVETIEKWDKFSQTEKTFYVELTRMILVQLFLKMDMPHVKITQ